MSDWGTTKARVGSDNDKKLNELFDRIELDADWSLVRPIGPITSYVGFWITVQHKGKKFRVFKMCTDYDPQTESFSEKIRCPYRKAYESGKFSYKLQLPNDRFGAQPAIRMEKKYIGNFIDREAQENEPRKKPQHTKKERKKREFMGQSFFWKDPDSKSWTPCKVLFTPPTLAVKFKSVTDLNKRTIKNKKGKKVTKVFPLSHPRYGMDVNVKHDSSQKGTAQYDAQRDTQNKLTEDELNYLLQDISLVNKVPTPEEATQEWERLKKMIVPADDVDDADDSDDDLDDMDDDDTPRKKKDKKGKKGKKVNKRSRADDDDDDDDDLEDLDDLGDLDDLDDDDAPKKKKKKKGDKVSSKTGKKRLVGKSKSTKKKKK